MKIKLLSFCLLSSFMGSINAADSVQPAIPAEKQASHRLAQRIERLEDLKPMLMEITESLLLENAELKQQLGQMAVPFLVTPYCVPPSINQNDSLTGVQFVQALFANLREWLLGTISELEQENTALRNVVEKAKINPDNRSDTNLFAKNPVIPIGHKDSENKNVLKINGADFLKTETLVRLVKLHDQWKEAYPKMKAEQDAKAAERKKIEEEIRLLQLQKKAIDNPIIITTEERKGQNVTITSFVSPRDQQIEINRKLANAESRLKNHDEASRLVDYGIIPRKMQDLERKYWKERGEHKNLYSAHQNGIDAYDSEVFKKMIGFDF